MRAFSLRGWMTIAAVLAFGFGSLHLIRMARAHGCDPRTLLCPPGVNPWPQQDTASYEEVADDIRADGVLGASYRARGPGYPLLLLASSTLTGRSAPLLWLTPLLAAVAAASTAWLGWLLAGERLAGAAIAAGVFLAWPATYQLAPFLMTDAPHAFLAVAALALTLAWRRDERPASAVAAAALWAAVLAIRPTFAALPFLLPVLLVRRTPARRTVLGSAAIVAAAALVPAAVVASNWAQHRTLALSVIQQQNVACYAAPRLAAELGRGDFHALRAACFERFEEGAAGAEERARADAWRLFAEHPGAALASHLRELRVQLFSPPRLLHLRHLDPLYPEWTRLGRRTTAAFWALALAGLVVVLRRGDPRLALFLLGVFVSVMAPATQSHLVENRLRLPLDVWAIPLVAAALCAPCPRAAGAR